MKLFVDDIRDAPDDTWHTVRTVTEAIRVIHNNTTKIKEISLDHDISYPVEVNGLSRPYPSPETFQAVAYYLASLWACPLHDAPNITLHTANPVGAREMEQILRGFKVVTKLSAPANRLEQ
mgnify:CR=1 FL=1